MKTKTIVAGLAAGILTFLLGYLIFGVLLMGYYNSNSISYPGLMRSSPTIVLLLAANLCWGILLAYILGLGGITTVAKGFTTGFITFLLFTAGIDMLYHGLMNLYTGAGVLVVDIILNAIIGGIAGALVAFIVGWKSAKA